MNWNPKCREINVGVQLAFPLSLFIQSSTPVHESTTFEFLKFPGYRHNTAKFFARIQHERAGPSFSWSPCSPLKPRTPGLSCLHLYCHSFPPDSPRNDPLCSDYVLGLLSPVALLHSSHKPFWRPKNNMGSFTRAKAPRLRFLNENMRTQLLLGIVWEKVYCRSEGEHSYPKKGISSHGHWEKRF